MSLEQLWSWLESTELAIRIGESWWFPLLESIHVVSITLVVGAILMVDLRLLGIAARSYAVTRLSNDLLPWAWGAFIVSVLTGVGMFITRAYAYAENPAFLIKVLLLLLAGANMAMFHFFVARKISIWDSDTPPVAARFASAASLILWCGTMLTGRWVGHIIG